MTDTVDGIEAEIARLNAKAALIKEAVQDKINEQAQKDQAERDRVSKETAPSLIDLEPMDEWSDAPSAIPKAYDDARPARKAILKPRRELGGVDGPIPHLSSYDPMTKTEAVTPTGRKRTFSGGHDVKLIKSTEGPMKAGQVFYSNYGTVYDDGIERWEKIEGKWKRISGRGHGFGETVGISPETQNGRSGWTG
ncbi:MAG TPA: hypothetical protein EYQ00_02645, partial [Dehalococcoidia bacterium]|nr:hypothetical protein [Dehalococcoidia bacterium]